MIPDDEKSAPDEEKKETGLAEAAGEATDDLETDEKDSAEIGDDEEDDEDGDDEEDDEDDPI